MIQQLLLNTIESGKTQLLATFNAVPDDKLSWKPLDLGRTALDLFGEAAQTTELVAQIAQTRGEYKPTRETFGTWSAQRASWTKQEALDALETHFAALTLALESLSEAELGAPVTMPIGGGMTLPLAGWIMMSYRTYISRFAQINYIQTLYGDMDSH